MWAQSCTGWFTIQLLYWYINVKIKSEMTITRVNFGNVCRLIVFCIFIATLSTRICEKRYWEDLCLWPSWSRIPINIRPTWWEGPGFHGIKKCKILLVRSEPSEVYLSATQDRKWSRLLHGTKFIAFTSRRASFSSPSPAGREYLGGISLNHPQRAHGGRRSFMVLQSIFNLVTVQNTAKA